MHQTSWQRNTLISFNIPTQMIIKRATLEDCHIETDIAIAIDVLRAFTTSAFDLEVRLRFIDRLG